MDGLAPAADGLCCYPAGSIFGCLMLLCGAVEAQPMRPHEAPALEKSPSDLGPLVELLDDVIADLPGSDHVNLAVAGRLELACVSPGAGLRHRPI